MPNASARFATARPIRPIPTMPSCLPFRSLPSCAAPRIHCPSRTSRSDSKPACQCDDEPHRQVRDGVVQHARRVADEHAMLRRGWHVDVVVADTEVRDDAQSWRYGKDLRVEGAHAWSQGRPRRRTAPPADRAWPACRALRRRSPHTPPDAREHIVRQREGEIDRGLHRGSILHDGAVAGEPLPHRRQNRAERAFSLPTRQAVLDRRLGVGHERTPGANTTEPHVSPYGRLVRRWQAG